MNTTPQDKSNRRSATPDDRPHPDIEDRKRAETLLAGENRLLKMLATGYTLSEILDALCRLIEDIASGSFCEIVLVDPINKRLMHGAAPSISVSYNQWIDGRPVNLLSGP